MKRNIFSIRKVLALACVPLLALQTAQAQKGAELQVSEASGSFAIVSAEGQAAQIVVETGEREVVGIAANLFASDVKAVTSCQLTTGNTPENGKPHIIVGTVGTSDVIGQLAEEQLIDLQEVEGQWETFGITATTYGGQPCLAVYGSDPRGTAYGLMELSRAIGVHPWTWWADITPETKSALYVSTSGTVYGPPSVKYRGLFINDEDWGLQPWAARNMDTDIQDIGPKTYEKVFELMLRMKANYLWPAMHPCTKAFWYYKDNPVLARKYDIVLGSSHCEPLLRNNVDEWSNNFMEEYGHASGDWNWRTNRETIVRYWTDRVVESKDNDAIYTMGMRGIHDSSMPGYSNNTEKQQALKDVIQTQRGILADNLGKNAEEVPQMFNPYKEALTLYRMGLDLPEDITLVWPDDNFGYIRQLSNPDEQKRPGGGGVYYHFSYWGIPNDHLWLSSVSPTLTSFEMCKAYDMNCKDIWIFNVGDIKPQELELQFAMDFSWDVEKWRPEQAHEYPYHWALEIFGDEQLAQRIAGIKKEYYRLAAAGKPEHVHAVSYSETELNRRIADYRNLSEEVQAVALSVPERLQDTYFELIGYPCQAAASMNEKILLARQSFTTASRGERDLALQQAQEALNAYQNIISLTNRYNQQTAGGKWNGIMDYAPRGLSHFKAPSVATESDVNQYEVIPPATPDIYKVSLKNYTASNGNIKVIEGLGIADTSITVLPLNMTSYDAGSIGSAPYVEYKVPVYKGYNTIKVKCLPTFPLYEGLDLRYAISMDGGSPTFKSIKMEAEASPWSTNVQTGYSYGEHGYTADADKEIRVRVYMADPGLTVSEIEVTRPDRSPYTDMLVNPGFEYKSEGVPNNGATTRGDVYGWTRTGTITGNSYGLSSDATNYQGTSICWYNSTPMPDKFELSQTVKDMPGGEYVVRCKLGVFNEQVSTQRLFANNMVQYYGPQSAYGENIDESESYSFAGNPFGKKDGAKGTLYEMAVKVTVLDGENLTVGIRSGNLLPDGSKATNNAGWFKVDDFRIELVRAINNDSLRNDLQELILQAEALLDSTSVPPIRDLYTQESRDAFGKAIEEAHNACSSKDIQDSELVAAIQGLAEAIQTYQDSATDFNSYIVNRSFEYKAEGELNDGSTVRGIPYGWNSIGNLIPDDWGNQSYGINNDAVNIVGRNCCWINSGVMPEPFELYQIIKGLPAGQYKVSCRLACFTNLITTQRLFANNNVTYFGPEEDYDKNLTEGENNSFAGLPATDDALLQELSVVVDLKDGEDLRIGIRSGNKLKDGTTATNNAGWFKVDEFTLTYIGDGRTVLDENKADNVIRGGQTCDIRLKRTLKADGRWETFCVPFDIGNAQAGNFFSDIRKLEGVEYTGHTCDLVFSSPLESMEAGVPYLVKAKEAATSLPFDNVTLDTAAPAEKAVTVARDGISVTMTGSYNRMDGIKDKYFISDNAFYFADEASDICLKGFRAYIELDSGRPEMEVNKMSIKLKDGSTTVDGISHDLTDAAEKAVDVYDLYGIKIRSKARMSEALNGLPQSIYVINGKKVIK